MLRLGVVLIVFILSFVVLGTAPVSSVDVPPDPVVPTPSICVECPSDTEELLVIIVEIEEDLGALEEEIVSFDGDVEALQGSVEELEEGVDDADIERRDENQILAPLSAVDDTVKIVEDRVSALRQSPGRFIDNLTNLRDRINRLQETIDDLRNQLRDQPTVTIRPPRQTIIETRRPPRRTVFRTIRPPRETVFRPGETRTVFRNRPGSTVTERSTARPQPGRPQITATSRPRPTTTVTEGGTVTRTVTPNSPTVSPTGQPTPSRDTLPPTDKPDEPTVIRIPPVDLSVPEAAGLGLLSLLILAGIVVAGMYAGYYIGYKDSERKNAEFLSALKDKFVRL